MIALAITGVLVEHIRSSRFGLRLEDGVPQLLCFDSLSTSPFFLVLFVQCFEFIAVDIGEPGCFIWTEERPLKILLHTTHEQIWGPESVEQIAGSHLFFSVILAKVEIFEHIGMPRLKVDGERAWSFVAALIDVACRIVEDAKHGGQAIGRAICATNIRARGSNTVHVETNPACILRDHCTSLEGVVDTLDTIFFHVDQKARSQLALWSAGIEQGGRGMRKAFLGHEIVGLDSFLDIVAMDTD